MLGVAVRTCSILLVTFLYNCRWASSPLCIDVPLGRMNRAPNETRTYSWMFTRWGLLTITPLEMPYIKYFNFLSYKKENTWPSNLMNFKAVNNGFTTQVVFCKSLSMTCFFMLSFPKLILFCHKGKLKKTQWRPYFFTSLKMPTSVDIMYLNPSDQYNELCTILQYTKPDVCYSDMLRVERYCIWHSKFFIPRSGRLLLQYKIIMIY